MPPPFRDRLPDIAAVVDPAEGLRMAAGVVGCPVAGLRIDRVLAVTSATAVTADSLGMPMTSVPPLTPSDR